MKIYFVSLGCDKNLVDSEHMLALLDGTYEIVNEAEECDIAIVNTCAFIKDAKEESINTILELAELKKNNIKYLVITGCLAERYSDELKKLIPEIDAYIGISGISNILNDINRVLNEKDVLVDKPDINASIDYTAKRFINPPYHTLFLKIAEGCDKRCTYCSIPSIRGSFRSVPIETLVKEAEYLALNGVKELILVAQETSVYGIDLYKKKSLPLLVEKLSQIEGIEWIRIMYCYPEEIDDSIIKMIKENKKVCHYLDIPIQHSSDRILKKMGRRTDNADLRNIIKKLRKNIPDISIRTSLIVGFPGEDEKDFDNLYQFVKEIEFDRLGVFTYSREEGTPAYNFPNQVHHMTKTSRMNKIMKLQKEISLKKNSLMAGKTFECLVEGFNPEENVYLGRLYKDAPDIDGCVFIETDRNLLSGDFVKVRITDYNEYDLIGVIDNESAE